MIVVSDASMDATATIARARGARVVEVDYRHIAATRNAGARAASGDALVFVDADTRLPARTLRRAIGALRNGAVGGGAWVHYDAAPWTSNVIAELFGVVWLGLIRWAAGCFVFCQRTAFEAISGFDERFYAGEELFISRALKRQGRFVILPTPVYTSGRKFVMWSTRRIMADGVRLLLAGPRAWRSRDRLDLWYGAPPTRS